MKVKLKVKDLNKVILSNRWIATNLYRIRMFWGKVLMVL